jgi:hypothetical protein
LSAFTHIWNAVGFPDQAPDDGTYIRRALSVVDGLGPQQGTFYDHPYFGQIFLGTIFSIVGYPDLATPSLPSSVQDLELSVGTLYTVPRMLMGILAVIDTFFVYKIAERRYNRNVAFIAAILFAITPLGWLFRRMYLDPIQIPFLLTSILFALYSGTRTKADTKIKTNTKTKAEQKSKLKEIVNVRTGREEHEELREREGQRQRQGEGYDNNYNSGQKIMSNQNIILLLSSGIFLGLTIFTKIPAITLIPLIGFIVFTNNKKSFKALGIWIIPVILIPLMWPIHALSAGDFDQWQEGILYQTTRISKPLFDAVNDFYNKDPVLLILGIAGFVFAAVTRRDFIFLFWVVPFLALFYVVDYVSHFHMIPLIPAFCIGAAVMISDLSDRITKNKKLVHKVLPIAIISAIAIFGLASTTSLIVKARNSSYFDVIALATEYLPKDDEKLSIASASGGPATIDNSENEHVTIIGTSKQFWIFQYVFDKIGYDYKSPNNMVSKTTLRNANDGSEKVLMIADENMRKIATGEELPRTSKPEIKAERISELYNGTKTVAKTHKVEIRTNY